VFNRRGNRTCSVEQMERGFIRTIQASGRTECSTVEETGHAVYSGWNEDLFGQYRLLDICFARLYITRNVLILYTSELSVL
jgi:hypothetical protein